ncbi:MAG: hypothetical protein EB828_02125 [Nitrosopumilus sp. D6]|nr:MAG: hypothetical protein EB828_02125 [Nitrosopumilus sp. D6]
MQTVSKIRKEIKIVNTVSTATLGQKVNIASFNKYKHLSTDLDLYRCGYVKDDKMTGRVTIFGNGKMISVGTKSSKDSFQELENSKKIMQKYKLIATVDFARPLHIESLARTIPKSMYEPEQFPGLIHRIRDSIVSLIFASGKVVIVGSKSFEDLNYAYFHLNQFLTR